MTDRPPYECPAWPQCPHECLRDGQVVAWADTLALGRDAMRLLDSVVRWYGSSRGRVVPEIEQAARWLHGNRPLIDLALEATPAPDPTAPADGGS